MAGTTPFALTGSWPAGLMALVMLLVGVGGGVSDQRASDQRASDQRASDQRGKAQPLKVA